MEKMQFPPVLFIQSSVLLNANIPPGAKALTILLRGYAKDGKAQVPQKHLAEALNINKITVGKWLKILVKEGVIEPVSRVDDLGRPVTYRFKLPEA